MRLILFRHGEAGMAPRDFDRCLTDAGIADVRKVACHIADYLSGAIAYVSPYIRARQTCTEIQKNAELKSCHELGLITPDEDPVQVLQWLSENQGASTVLLVTHQPLVSRLTSLLLDGDETGFYPMATASVTVVQADIWGAGLARLETVIHADDLE
ncbi:SixA phosphatase family protein [Oceanospirillum sp.]|uniref:SixA phosphatase family protein n=1 Tax=Oceanospirillum sp. TaxID=2021254 RepID=UPI003A8CACF9